MSFGLPGNIRQALAVDNGAGLSRFSRTTICNVLPPADFPPRQYKTHTYTASTLSLASAPAGETEVCGGRGRKMAPDCGRRGWSPALRWAPRPGRCISTWPASAARASPRPWEPDEGCSRDPVRMAAPAEERGRAHHSAWDPSPALRWLPAAVYPGTVGPAGRRAAEGAKIRARTGRLASRGDPLAPRARCSSGNRRSRGPSCPAPRPGTGSRRPRVSRPRGRAGLRGRGCECEQGGRREAAGAHKGRGEGAGGGGLAGPEPRP